jgi:hypothetical protein
MDYLQPFAQQYPRPLLTYFIRFSVNSSLKFFAFLLIIVDAYLLKTPETNKELKKSLSIWMLNSMFFTSYSKIYLCTNKTE